MHEQRSLPMGMASPTRTTNRLHLTDLDATRFEDLCLALVYPLHLWTDIRHYGRSGSDDGVDIFAKEPLEAEQARTWFIQCRRYSRASKAVLLKAVDDALRKSPETPDVLLVVVACDVRKEAHEAYAAYASAKGIRTPMLWTQSIIEAQLHSVRPDLLFTFFGISEVSRFQKRAASIRRNITLKKRLKNEFLYRVGEEGLPPREERLKNPSAKFRYSRFIIHSIDDTYYPEVARDQGGGIYSWFRVEAYDFYHNGIQVVLRGVAVIVEPSTGKWAVLDWRREEPIDTARYIEVSAGLIGCIPYRNIVDVDTDGDEYYSYPHIYCQFADRGEPYEEFLYYVTTKDGHHHFLDAKDRFEYKAASGGVAKS